MSLTTHSISIAEFIPLLKQNAADYLQFVPILPKKDAPAFKSQRCETRARMDTKDPFVKVIFYARDLYVVNGPFDPEQSKFKKENPDDVTMTLSMNNSGTYGEFIELFNVERDRQIKAMKGTPGIPSKPENEKWVEMIMDCHSDKSHKDRAGKQFTDPKDSSRFDKQARVKLDFSVWSEKMRGGLAGRPKSTLEDFTTGKMNDAETAIVYEPLMHDGLPVSAANAHKAIRSGTEIIEAYISLESTTFSNVGVITNQLLTRAVVAVSAAKTFEPAEKRAAKPNNDLLERVERLKAEKAAAIAKLEAEALQTASADTASTEVKASLANLEKVVDDALAPAPSVLDNIASVIDNL